MRENGGMDSVRMDKWLWAARFFKTRALASKACELGRIEANLYVAKAARDVKVGDRLKVKNASGEFVVDVLGISDVRGSAAVAQAMYRETEESKFARAQVAEARKSIPVFESAWEGGGRPTKRDRRVMNKFRGR
jgi:ribosome-associated heat shock protein Hsp15